MVIGDFLLIVGGLLILCIVVKVYFITGIKYIIDGDFWSGLGMIFWGLIWGFMTFLVLTREGGD